MIHAPAEAVKSIKSAADGMHKVCIIYFSQQAPDPSALPSDAANAASVRGFMGVPPISKGIIQHAAGKPAHSS